MTHSHTVRIEFGSAFDMLDFVQVVSDYIGRMSGLDDDSLHWVSVAVRECVVNAIKHGNRNDESKRGIFLIRNFMDDVQLQRGKHRGMEIRMVKKVPKAGATT